MSRDDAGGFAWPVKHMKSRNWVTVMGGSLEECLYRGAHQSRGPTAC